jgi:SSS family transporter
MSLRCLFTLFFLALAGGPPAHAKSLISLKVTTLSPPEASAAALAPASVPLPVTNGPAAGLLPLAGLTHYGSNWLLARDLSGTIVWLGRTSDGGWQKKSAPPAHLRPEIHAGGQAHILGVVADGTGEAAIWTYHIITNQWAEIARTPLPGTLTALAPARDGFVFSTRDAAGAVRHTLVTIALTKRLLQWLDWAVILLYLVGTSAIGLYYYLREKKHSNDEFFLGGRNIPWWAAGVSLYATGTSAISYIAIPAKSFDTNWLYLAANVIGLMGNFFIAIWIVPLIRRLNLMSVYQYLEMRFHPKIRVLASALAIVLQLGGRMSIVLFLPSLAMAAVTGLNVTDSILIMGVVTIVYTFMGGMKAVIWTDFIQVFVMLGGAFFAIGYMVLHLDGGFPELLRVAAADDKMRIFDWSFDLTKATVWGFLLAAVIGVITYPQDQVMMQRVLSTKSDKEAGWSMWTLAAIVVPGSFTFFAIGTVLYVFYQQHPDRLNPLLNVDSTFPQFIASELPVGITGLLIAGIFAASMSTLSSCINSVATLVSVDFYERYAKNPTPAKSVRLAEWMTVIGGLIGVGTALLLAMVDVKSALDKSYELAGLLGGGFAGCYGLGLFTRRANWQGAMIGVIGSLVVTFIAWTLHLVHPVFYIMIAVASCLVVGYFASYLFPAPAQSLEGLTIYTPRKTPLATTA